MNNKSPVLSERFWSRVDVQETIKCWAWRGPLNRYGYGVFHPFDRNTVGAHRVAFFLRNGKWPNHCLHKCDNPKCCNPDHLYDGDHKQNMADMVSRGRQRKPFRGEDDGRAVLTNAIVTELRRSYKRGEESMRDIANRLGCGQTTIQRVIAGITWRHLL